jgi:uncharacterized membrane protein (UPF0127 family)
MLFQRSATLRTASAAHPTPGHPTPAHPLRLRVANTLWGRFRGLMLSAPLQTEPTRQALLITRCTSVHGFFMRYTIDVVYLCSTHTNTNTNTNTYTVTRTATLKPWRASFGKSRTTRPSAHALELPAGSIQSLGIAPGDTLEILP